MPSLARPLSDKESQASNTAGRRHCSNGAAYHHGVRTRPDFMGAGKPSHPVSVVDPGSQDKYAEEHSHAVNVDPCV